MPSTYYHANLHALIIKINYRKGRHALSESYLSEREAQFSPNLAVVNRLRNKNLARERQLGPPTSSMAYVIVTPHYDQP
jgi:hypothetical protein